MQREPMSQCDAFLSQGPVVLTLPRESRDDQGDSQEHGKHDRGRSPAGAAARIRLPGFWQVIHFGLQTIRLTMVRILFG
ncbi:hypothetical protein GCM10009525_15820 [Streptosporangium amethystogenes subsp. fukuiense]